MIPLASIILTFFNPSLRLQSGRQVELSGKVPPLVFSPGLFGTMPAFLYSDFLNNLKKNLTVITFKDYNAISSNDITDLTRALSVESVSYLSHSSFNSDIMDNNNINSAVLLDPICVPEISPFGVGRKEIMVDFPVLEIKAEKLYKNDPKLPDWQKPELKGNITEYFYEDVGHPDILNDNWANFAKVNGFWDTTDGVKQSFKEWKLNTQSIKKVRKEYRSILSDKIINFIL